MVEGHDQFKTVGDILSFSTVAATILGWLPHLAAILSIIWSAIRIYETKTVQRFLSSFKRKT